MASLREWWRAWMAERIPYPHDITGPGFEDYKPFRHAGPIPRSLVWRYRLQGRHWNVFADWKADQLP